jgi:hypothetical protein
MARFMTLTNFGRTYGDHEDKTVPIWLLPGGRTYLDKPDFLTTWLTQEQATPHAPPPTRQSLEPGLPLQVILGELVN